MNKVFIIVVTICYVVITTRITIIIVVITKSYIIITIINTLFSCYRYQNIKNIKTIIKILILVLIKFKYVFVCVMYYHVRYCK